MKKSLNLLLVILSSIAFFTKIDVTYAEENDNKFYYGDWIEDIFVRKDNGIKVQNQQSRFTRRVSDNMPVYCIEHGILVYDDAIYEKYLENNETITGHNNEKINKAKLISYYGYGFENHTEDKWYAITQVLIWKTIYPDMDISYTDTFRGEKIVKFVEEEKEILDLVEKHMTKPKFDYDETLHLNDSLKLVDTNNVLSDYEIEENEYVDVSKEKNYLIIKPKKVGTAKIKLYKKANKYGFLPLIYTNPSSQNLMSMGDYETVEEYINLNIIPEEIPKETIVVEVPKTLSNSYLYIYSIIFITLGSGLIYEKRKHK